MPRFFWVQVHFRGKSFSESSCSLALFIRRVTCWRIYWVLLTASNNTRNSLLSVEIDRITQEIKNNFKKENKTFPFFQLFFRWMENERSSYIHSHSKWKLYWNMKISSRKEVQSVSQLCLKVLFWIHSTSEASPWFFQRFWKAVLYFHFKMHIKALHMLQCAFSATKMLLILNF